MARASSPRTADAAVAVAGHTGPMLGSPLRSWSLLSLLLGLTAVAAHAGPPRGTGTIVVGVTGIDSPETRLLLVDTTPGTTATGPIEGGTVLHLAGHAPMGVVVDDQHVALVVRAGSRDDGLLLLRDLGTGIEQPLLDGVMATHAPLVRHRPDQATEIVAVRHSPEEIGGATFDVVAVDVKSGTGQVLASAPRLWLTPVQGASDDVAFLVIDGAPGFQPKGARNSDGHAHVDVVKDGILTLRWTLGPGTFRSPVCTASRCVVEQERDGHAVLTDEQGKTLLKGRPGLQPVATATTLAVSSSHKDGSVLVAVGDAPFARWTSGRAGVARPLALVESAGDTTGETVVVAWLDRGPMEPGELWAIAKGGARLLLPPTARTAVTVYGVLPQSEGSR
jgi:hypothetical protein